MTIRITNLSFDENQDPGEVTLSMSVAEAAHLVRLVGKLSPATAVPPESYPAASELYRCLVSNVFNAYWEDGVDGFREG